MSLIHKALKKVEGERAHPPGSDVDEVFVGGGGGGFSDTKSRVRMLLLGVVVLGAGAYGWKMWQARQAAPAVPEVAAVTPEAVISPAAGGAAVAPTGKLSATSDRLPTSESEAAAPADPNALPPSIAATVAAGEEAFAQGKFDDALTQFQQAAEQEPKLAYVWNNIGMTQKKLAKLDDAEKAYNQALEADANYPQALNNLGTLKVTQGNALEGALLFRKALAADAKYADAHFNLALLMEEEGNWRSAVEEYKLFLKHGELDAKFREQIEQHIEEIAP